ncbi:hypothetical protein ACOME3_006382 [Neoechinorhynchus agilis]
MIALLCLIAFISVGFSKGNERRQSRDLTSADCEEIFEKIKETIRYEDKFIDFLKRLCGIGDRKIMDYKEEISNKSILVMYYKDPNGDQEETLNEIKNIANDPKYNGTIGVCAYNTEFEPNLISIAALKSKDRTLEKSPLKPYNQTEFVNDLHDFYDLYRRGLLSNETEELKNILQNFRRHSIAK